MAISTVEWDSYTTFICSSLSLIGSVIVLCAYTVAQSRTNPRAAQLIRNLAIADFVWFAASLTQSSYWIFTDVSVPDLLCYTLSPILLFMRIASLMWTCAVSFDVLMSVNKRKWLWAAEENWATYRRIYYIVVLVFALPGAILNSVKQHANANSSDLGCNPGYEKIGEWYCVFFTELLPISVGFLANIIVYISVRERMTMKAFPQSVRKRRRRIMYHYIIVCIVCWTPTMVFYLSEIAGLHSSALEIIARSSLYMTGFLNFIVFGMQDPHLRRSFYYLIHSCGCLCCSAEEDGLKRRSFDKTVMFGGHIEDNADVSKDKKNIYRYHKLTSEDKMVLYHDRPDLDPHVVIGKSSDSMRRKNRSIDISAVRSQNDDGDTDEETACGSTNLNAPLLSEEEKRNMYDVDSDVSVPSSANSSHHSVDDILASVGGCGGDANDDDDIRNGAVSASLHDALREDGDPKSREMEPMTSPPTESVLFGADGNNAGADLLILSGHRVSGISDTVIHDVENPVGSQNVRMGYAERRQTSLERMSSERRQASLERRAKLGRPASSDGPMVSDEEFLARSQNNNVSPKINTAGSSSGSLLLGPSDDPDSSGDEADEEDHALAEVLAQSPGRIFVRSP